MPRFFRTTALAILCLALGIVTTVAARADSVDDAKDLFARGRDMRARGDCAGAVVLFRKAYSLYPSGLGSVRNLAECEESLGRFASARRAWLDLKRALATTTDAKYAGWSADAEQAAARLAPRVATLTIDVALVTKAGERALTDGSATVLLNGEPLAPSLIGVALDRDPGRYVVRIEGTRLVGPSEQTVDLLAGDVKRVALRAVIAEAPSPQPTSTSPLPPRAEPAPPSGTQRTLAWTAIGVGAASLVAGVVSLVVRQSALSSLEAACPQYARSTCDPSTASTVDRGKLASTLTTVFGIVGVAGLAAGAVLFVTAPKSSTRIGVSVAPQQAAISARWAF